MARVKFYNGTENALASHTQEDGAIYITTDTKNMYADINGSRIKIIGSGGGTNGGTEYSFNAPLVLSGGDTVDINTGDGLFLAEDGALSVSPTPVVTQEINGLMSASDKIKLDKLAPDIVVEMTHSSSGLVCRACKDAIFFSAPNSTAQQLVSRSTIDATFTGTYECTQAEADIFLASQFYSTFGAQTDTLYGPWYNTRIYVYSSEIGYASVRPWCTYDGTQLNFSIRAYVRFTRSPSNSLRSYPVAWKV